MFTLVKRVIGDVKLEEARTEQKSLFFLNFSALSLISGCTNVIRWFPPCIRCKVEEAQAAIVAQEKAFCCGKFCFSYYLS